MSKIKPEVYYKCDICGNKADRHFKVKIPVSGTNLEKWKRFDMCDRCFMEFYRKCTQKNTSDYSV